jgi:hypothetical protein
MAWGSQRDYHTVPERHIQRLLLHHHDNDAFIRFMPFFFQLSGGCPSSGNLSSACALLRLDPLLVRREILSELLWLGHLLTGCACLRDPSLSLAIPSEGLLEGME